MLLQKLSFLIGILLSLYSYNGFAQVIISGQVRDNITHIGVPNHQVTIASDTNYLNTSFYFNTVVTDNQGFFSDSIFFATSTSKYYLITLDCNQNPVIDSFFSAIPTPVSLDICTGGINMCIADFIAYPDSADYQLIHFYNLSSFNATSYLWSFGDGNYAVAKNPDHHYNLGTYQVCLTITDSASGCTNTYCDSLTMSPTMNCQSSFTYSLIGQKKYSFSASINNTYPTIYAWDFGDYTYGNGKNTTHQYQQPGSYTVKLKSTSFHPQTLDTCISFYQENIQVNGSPTAGLWGQVFADSNSIDNGVVYLYSYNSNNHNLSFVDSTMVQRIDSINISYYIFSNLNYGKYVIYLKLLANSVYNQNYGSAYSGNTIYWDKSFAVSLNKASTNFPLNLTHLYKQNGTSSISGYVYQGNKANVGDPIAGVPIFILDNAKVIVDFQYSQSNGSYSFQGLSPQKYFIYCDVINHSIYPADALLTLQNQHINNINIYIGSSVVTSIETAKLPNDFKIYPNPANKVLSFEFVNPKSQVLNYRITNILGESVLYNSILAKKDRNTYKIDVSHLQSGVFVFSVESHNKTIFRHKLIIAL